MSKSKKFKNRNKEVEDKIRSADELNDLIEGRITYADFIRDTSSEEETIKTGMHQIFSDIGYEDNESSDTETEDDIPVSSPRYDNEEDEEDSFIDGVLGAYKSIEEDNDIEYEDALTTNDLIIDKKEDSYISSNLIHGVGSKHTNPFTKFEVAGNGYSVFTDIRPTLERYDTIPSVDDNDELSTIIEIFVNYIIVSMYPSYIYTKNNFFSKVENFKDLKTSCFAKPIFIRVNDYIFVYLVDRNFVGSIFSYVNEFVNNTDKNLYTAYATFLSDIAKMAGSVSYGYDEKLMDLLYSSRQNKTFEFEEFLKDNQDEESTSTILEANPVVNISEILKSGSELIEDFVGRDEVMPSDDEEDEEEGKSFNDVSLKDVVSTLSDLSDDELKDVLAEAVKESNSEEYEDDEDDDEDDESDDLFSSMEEEGAEKVDVSTEIDALTPSNKTTISIKK